MTRQELKSMAKQQIQGNIGVIFVINLIVYAISVLAGVIPVVGSVASVVIAPAFSLSLTMVYLSLTRGIQAQISDAFAGFQDLWTAFKTTFLVGLFTMLWSLLFCIPGIIKAISYSQAMFIVAENPGISALEAIDRSKAMMDGHKMDYFVMGLSFLGWEILGAFTFGLLYIWLVPYMQTTYANFYNSIKPGAETPTE